MLNFTRDPYFVVVFRQDEMGGEGGEKIFKTYPGINILPFSLEPSPKNDSFTRFLAPTPKDEMEGEKADKISKTYPQASSTFNLHKWKTNSK